MKYCQKCGKTIQDEAVVCVHCGCSVAASNPVAAQTKFCEKCGMEIRSDAVVCVHCGCSVTGNLGDFGEDKASVGLLILSFIIPLAGLILWIVKKNEAPNTAKQCLTLALVSWVISILISMASVIFWAFI